MTRVCETAEAAVVDSAGFDGFGVAVKDTIRAGEIHFETPGGDQRA